jgi:hypothetical protein
MAAYQINYPETILQISDTESGSFSNITPTSITTPNLNAALIRDGSSSTGVANYVLTSQGPFQDVLWQDIQAINPDQNIANVLAVSVAGDAEHQPITNLSRVNVNSVETGNEVNINTYNITGNSYGVGQSFTINAYSSDSKLSPTSTYSAQLNTDNSSERAELVAYFEGSSSATSLHAGISNKFNPHAASIYAVNQANALQPIHIGNVITVVGADATELNISSVGSRLSLNTQEDTGTTRSWSHNYLPIQMGAKTYYLPLFE